MNVIGFALTAIWYIILLIIAIPLFFYFLPMVPQDFAWLYGIVFIATIVFTVYKIYEAKKEWTG